MKFIVTTILIAFLSFVTCLYMPWWTIAITAFMVSLFIHQRPLMAFGSGFLALFCLWGVLSFLISSSNEHILAHKLSVLMVQADNVFMLILLTALIGALVGGFGSLTASYLAAKPQGTDEVARTEAEPVGLSEEELRNKKPI